MTKEDAQFAYYLADGMKKTSAFVAIWGYKNNVVCNRVVVRVAVLVALLREESEAHLTEQLNMDKNARLEHILLTALQAHRMYIASNEAAHGAVYLKAMTIINTMTGDNAPTEVHHLVSVSKQQLEDMSHSQRTNAYKRMMSGNLELIESPTQLNATDNTTTHTDTTHTDSKKGRTFDHAADDDGGQP